MEEAIDLYHFLFETYAGIGVLVGAGIVLSIIICVILEFKTRKLYRNHEIEEGVDEWSLFDDIEEGEAEEEEKLAKKDK